MQAVRVSVDEVNNTTAGNPISSQRRCLAQQSKAQSFVYVCACASTTTRERVDAVCASTSAAPTDDSEEERERRRTSFCYCFEFVCWSRWAKQEATWFTSNFGLSSRSAQGAVFIETPVVVCRNAGDQRQQKNCSLHHGSSNANCTVDLKFAKSGQNMPRFLSFRSFCAFFGLCRAAGPLGATKFPI